MCENSMVMHPFTSPSHVRHECLPHTHGVREKQSAKISEKVFNCVVLNGQYKEQITPVNLSTSECSAILRTPSFQRCCFIYLYTYYLQLQHEARLSMEFLDNRFLDGFEVLFMKPVPFTQTFDQSLL